MALKDIPKDIRLYSGWNRYKLITADLAPVIFGTALGHIDRTTFGIPIAGSLAVVCLEIIWKEYIKAEAPTDREEEVRKYNQEVKNNR